MIRLYIRCVDALMRAIRVLIAVLLIASVLLNFANIVGRYAFHAPLIGAEEMMMFLMIAIVFLGAAVVAREGRHIKMDIIVGLLPVPAQKVIHAVVEVLAIAVTGMITYLAIPLIQHLAAFNERSQAANIPLAIPQAAIPVGFTLLILATVARLLEPAPAQSAREQHVYELEVADAHLDEPVI
jgi:TRAP-type C4-dicarboxylate transport system permease small subunit